MMINILLGALYSGWDTLYAYLTEHVVTCLVPAFFITGAIAAFVKKEAILKYFSPEARKTTSYGIASVSGAVFAVCSCTILPMFAGILKKGSGLGPTVTFIYAGPAINILVIVYTAKVLGGDLGLAQGMAAIVLSIVIGLMMASLFPSQDEGTAKATATTRRAALTTLLRKPGQYIWRHAKQSTVSVEADIGDVDQVIVIDGCSDCCAKKNLSASRIAHHTHIIATDLGITKYGMAEFAMKR